MNKFVVVAFVLSGLIVSCKCTENEEFEEHEEREHVARSPLGYDGSVMTTLEVSDVNASKAWYVEMLGCEVVYELPEHGWCQVATPTEGAMIGLGQVEAGTPLRGTGGASVSFGVEDIAKARAWLAEHGAKVGEVMEIPDVVKLLEFEDPDGNKLMLYEAADAD